MSDSQEKDQPNQHPTILQVETGGTYPADKALGSGKSGALLDINFKLQQGLGHQRSLSLDGKTTVQAPSQTLDGKWLPDRPPAINKALGITGTQRFGKDEGMYGVMAGGVEVTKATPIAVERVQGMIDSALQPLRSAYEQVDLKVEAANQQIAETQAKALAQITTTQAATQSQINGLSAQPGAAPMVTQLQAQLNAQIQTSLANVQQQVDKAEQQVTEQAAAARASLPNLDALETVAEKVSTVKTKSEVSLYGSVLAGITFKLTPGIEGDVNAGAAMKHSLNGDSHGYGVQAGARIGHGLAHLPQPLPAAGPNDLPRTTTVAAGDMQGGDWQLSAHYRHFSNQRDGSIDPVLQRNSGEEIGVRGIVAVSAHVALTAELNRISAATHVPDALTQYVPEPTPRQSGLKAQIGAIIRF